MGGPSHGDGSPRSLEDIDVLPLHPRHGPARPGERARERGHLVQLNAAIGGPDESGHENGFERGRYNFII
jgi:hypothetical protein